MAPIAVGIVGSSGGGGAGEAMGVSLVNTVASHLRRIKTSPAVAIRGVVFVSASNGLDFATEDSLVSLYCGSDIDGTLSLKCISSGTLASVNKLARTEDETLARDIKEGAVQALVVMSSDPEGVNSRSVSAAVAAGIPIVGTGGKCMSYIASAGGLVVGSSGGSVASTQSSRAICFAAALAAHWGLDYEISSGTGAYLTRAHAVCGASLPILLASSSACLLLDSVLHVFQRSPLITDISMLRHSIATTLLNVAVTAVTCKELTQMNDLALLTGACAGAIASDAPLPLAMANGLIAAHLLPRALVHSSRLALLPTAATIISIGGVAVVSGVVTFMARRIAEIYFAMILNVTLDVANAVSLTASWPIEAIFGAVLGVVISWGSENGYYHTVMLPMIALEMDSGRFGVLGCYDALCLCAPCAGVCAAVFLHHYLHGDHRRSSKSRSKMNLGWRGALSNLLMGDFVEACYPFSLPSAIVLMGVRATCAIVGGLIFRFKMKSSAYLPLPISWCIAVLNDSQRIHWISLAFSLALGIPFLVTFLDRRIESTIG